LRGDPDVAHAGQVEPGADRMAVDGGDHRQLAVPQRERDALDAAPVVVARGQRRRQRTDSHPIAHRLEIAAGTECTAGAGEDQHRHLGVGAGALDGVDQRLAVGVAADGIALAGSGSSSA
jgi:hypothetical protein